jgi:UDP-glucose 4-epimerase
LISRATTDPQEALRGKRILVTGGAGFIGSHLVDQLTQEPLREIVVLDDFVRGTHENLKTAMTDERVRVVEGSITDRVLLHDLMQGIDYVAHLAALWLYDCERYPRTALEVNVVGTYNVVEAAHEAGVAKLVYSSSASVYGEAVSIPMSEEHPFNSRTMYGATKIAGEQFLRAFYGKHRLDYVGLRYMNVYGPRLQYEGSYVSVVMNVLNRIRQGAPPIIFGDGSQVYDFTYVDDAARANILALASSASDEFINVGTGVGTTINDLVYRLLEATGSVLVPEYRPQEKSLVARRVGSTHRAEELLGFRARMPLRDGLASTVRWWKVRGSSARGPGDCEIKDGGAGARAREETKPDGG